MTHTGGLLPSTRLAVQVAAAGALSALVVDQFGLERPYWVMMSAVLVMVGSVGETLAKGLDRTVGTLLGIIAGIGFDAVATRLGVPELPVLAAAIAATAFQQFVSYRAMIAALTVALVILFRLGGADDSVLLARLTDTAIGAAIAGLTSLLILPIPTQRPVKAAIDAYLGSLAAMIDKALAALASGVWNDTAQPTPEALRTTEASFEDLSDALRLQMSLIGGRGRMARIAHAALPALRSHAESVADAARAAASAHVGGAVSEELSDARRTLADNLAVISVALTDGRSAPVSPLDPILQRMEQVLSPRFAADAGTRGDVILFLNAMLALRRFNRALRHIASQCG